MKPAADIFERLRGGESIPVNDPESHKLGAALMEEVAVDKRIGFFVNHDLAGYEVPVHADVPHLDAIFIDEVDATLSPLKAKGVGELGMVGIPAAIANAVFHATGKRFRDLPITPDQLLSVT